MQWQRIFFNRIFSIAQLTSLNDSISSSFSVLSQTSFGTNIRLTFHIEQVRDWVHVMNSEAFCMTTLPDSIASFAIKVIATTHTMTHHNSITIILSYKVENGFVHILASGHISSVVNPPNNRNPRKPPWFPSRVPLRMLHSYIT